MYRYMNPRRFAHLLLPCVYAHIDTHIQRGLLVVQYSFATSCMPQSRTTFFFQRASKKRPRIWLLFPASHSKLSWHKGYHSYEENQVLLDATLVNANSRHSWSGVELVQRLHGVLYIHPGVMLLQYQNLASRSKETPHDAVRIFLLGWAGTPTTKVS